MDRKLDSTSTIEEELTNLKEIFEIFENTRADLKYLVPWGTPFKLYSFTAPMHAKILLKMRVKTVQNVY